MAIHQNSSWASVGLVGTLFAALQGAACSSGTLGGNPSTDAGPDVGGCADMVCPDTVGSGTPCCPAPAYSMPDYPRENFGSAARTSPDIEGRGDRIKNFNFVAYRPESERLEPVELSDYYEPNRETHDVLVIVAGATWCRSSKPALDAVHSSSKRIATLFVMGEGPTPGQPSDQVDLDRARTVYSSWTTSALDPAFANLRALFDDATLPAIIFIDTRSMEIVAVKTGDLMTTAEIDETVSVIADGPPLY